MKSMIKACAILATSVIVAGSAAASQLSVEVSKTIPVRIKGKAASVVIGNQNIAQVSTHDENLVFVTGKTFGTTNLLVFDRDGRSLYDAEVVVTVNTSNLVSVNRSGTNYTYDCAPECRSVLSTGDDAAYFEVLMKQHRDMQILTEGN